MKQKITHIHPWSVAKFLFIGDVLFLMICLIPVGFFFIFINRAIHYNPANIFFLPPPLTALPLLPLIFIGIAHPFFVAIVGALAAGFYNIVAKLLGGIEVTMES